VGKRVARVLMGVVVASAMLVTSPVRVEAQLSTQPFAAYGNAAAVALNALALGTTQVANTQIANSGGVVNSTGLGGTVNNQFGQAVQPPQPAGKNAYGRGSGVELGLVTPTIQATDVNQLKLTQVAEANAAPPSGLVDKVTNINLPPLLTASTARGQAQATYDPNFCPIGRPLTFGLGYVENLQVLPQVGGGLVGTSSTGNSVTQTRTVTYVVPNGDGTYGVVAESQAIVAPISVAGTGITIDVAGPIGFRVTATGKPGDPRNGAAYTGTPVITVRLNGIALLDLALSDILGAGGIDLNIPPAPLPALVGVSVGAPPKGLNGTGAPAVAPDGTSASASADTLRLKLLNLPGISALDVGLGHFEGAVSVPAGGIRCTLPVSKVANPDPVPVGQDTVFTISIPSDPGLFNALFACDLVNIRAVDTVEVASGTVNFTILSADHGGVIGPANVVTWENLGSYALGDPPLQLNLAVRINSASGEAVIRDIVDVSAALGNCRGRAAGDDMVLGSGQINGNAITGRFVLNGPTISGDLLASTGGTSAPLVMGGALVLGGLGLMRLRRTLIQRRV
jgi:hypothetical protein